METTILCKDYTREMKVVEMMVRYEKQKHKPNLRFRPQ